VKLNARLQEPSLQEYFSGIFPQDTMQNMRFSINFFTSIGLGGITDRQRELYKQVRVGGGGAGGVGGQPKAGSLGRCVSWGETGWPVLVRWAMICKQWPLWRGHHRQAA
jgi:hypothetical protein